jgi:hypothetical protein
VTKEKNKLQNKKNTNKPRNEKRRTGANMEQEVPEHNDFEITAASTADDEHVELAPAFEKLILDLVKKEHPELDITESALRRIASVVDQSSRRILEDAATAATTSNSAKITLSHVHPLLFFSSFSFLALTSIPSFLLSFFFSFFFFEFVIDHAKNRWKKQ